MTDHERKFLIFSLQHSLYALDLAQIAEVSDPPTMWPIPLEPAGYSGAMNFHGDIVAIMNLAFFMGLAGHSQSEKIIVLNREVASLAFLVDTVVKIISESEISICLVHDKRFALATLGLPGGEAILLDLETLVQSAVSGIRENRIYQQFELI